ncbi:prepilin peptidase [Streptacidiphilus rugosus]|uniref:prepilin peptidase n=1 Tax=Streptacidiphilus rugosus TaxID=405783 RepID=UPI00068CD34B|nr:A24 family peptidase [Streptacidiphilus rugosus]
MSDAVPAPATDTAALSGVAGETADVPEAQAQTAADTADADTADADTADAAGPDDGDTAVAEQAGRWLRVFPRPDAETLGVLRADALPLALGAALAVAALVLHDGWSLRLPAHVAFALVAVALTALDARLRRLPDALTYPAYPLLLLLLCLPGAGGPLLGAVLASLVLAFVYYLLALFGGAGLGDVKASALVGLVLGYLGWRSVLAGTVYAMLLAGVWAVALLVARRVGRRSQLAFGPFLMTGALLALLV